MVAQQTTIALCFTRSSLWLCYRFQVHSSLVSLSILNIYVCPHHWNDHCFCRKPNPGLFFQASRDWLLRLDKTIFVGDDPRDCQAAYNAGCDSIFLGKKNDLKNLSLDEQPLQVFEYLNEAISYLAE